MGKSNPTRAEQARMNGAKSKGPSSPPAKPTATPSPAASAPAC